MNFSSEGRRWSLQILKSDCLGSGLGSATHCVTLHNYLILSVPQFLHLVNGIIMMSLSLLCCED